jgi:hypothetical protein
VEAESAQPAAAEEGTEATEPEAVQPEEQAAPQPEPEEEQPQAAEPEAAQPEEEPTPEAPLVPEAQAQP